MQEFDTKVRAEQGAPRSVLRVLNIFEVLVRSEDGMTLAELSAELQVPKSSLLMLIRPISDNGYVTHVNNRYRLGPKMFGLASAVVSVTSPFRDVLRPFMAKLVRQTDESAALMVLDRDTGSATFVDAFDGPQVVRYNAPVGARLPLYCSSGGRVFLAFGDEDWRDEYLKSARLKQQTALTITDKAELRRVLQDVRDKGFSVSVGESALEAAGVAAPIFDSKGAVIAALVAAAPTERFERTRTKLEKEVPAIAVEASAAMGHLPSGARLIQQAGNG